MAIHELKVGKSYKVSTIIGHSQTTSFITVTNTTFVDPYLIFDGTDEDNNDVRIIWDSIVYSSEIAPKNWHRKGCRLTGSKTGPGHVCNGVPS